MKKDIPVQKVADIAIAIVPNDEILWDVYLVNLKKTPIRNVLVTSRGYGERNEEKVETSRLRYYWEDIAAETAIKIEAIQTELFDLAHEYWLSFQSNDFLFDRKYVFVRGSISKDYFTLIPIVDKQGIMIL